MTNTGKAPGFPGHRVFISYCHEKSNEENIPNTTDRITADLICSALESQGFRCWIDHRDIAPGDEWLSGIIDAVEKSQVVVLVLSANTEKSGWVKDEITLALNKNIKIIPFRIENIEPQGALRILKVRCQWLDAFSPNLEKHIERLVKVVRDHLEKERVLPPEGVPGPPGSMDRVNKIPVPKTPGLLQLKGKKLPRLKRVSIALSIIIPLAAAGFLIFPPAKKENTPPGEITNINTNARDYPPAEFTVSQELPGFIKVLVSKGASVKKNGNDSWVAVYKDYGITIVYIPGGKFRMGADDGDDDEKPPHEVDLDGFWMGKYEVTFALYDRFCAASGKKKPDDQDWGREYRPVINVSWDDAVGFCKWLSRESGLDFKLPTEAQWEKAARGTDGRIYNWGNSVPNKNLANFNSHTGCTVPVGSFPEGASPYGLQDMAGNVMEWCSDWYDADYYKNSPSKNPPGPDSGSYRVIRGGGWGDEAGVLRCSNRNYTPSQRYSNVGFRLALVPGLN